ncbi:MAG: YihY/virulence factor BrkB family protein [Pirellulales bacterium]|nr:YihY/virulence factor BrkB family protein [Pirellulales bacterium]
MFRQRIESLMGWLRRVITQPREELDRWQRAARFTYDLGRHGGQQLKQDNAPQMAAALAFRTLFALIPVLVVSMIVVKATKGTESFLRLVRDLFGSWNLNEIHVIPPGNLAAGSTGERISLAVWLEKLIGQAAHVNLAAVGWIGVAVIGYAAISLMVTIENSFNAIYRAPEARPWTQRIPLYWFVLTASPVALGITWYLNRYVETWIELFRGWQLLLIFASVAWSVVVGWLVLFAVYILVPNTRVAWKPAMAGALVAALLIEIGKRFLDVYLGHAFSISQLYGSLGLVPLFMFWVYLMWLAVLFGLEVCAILHRLGGRELDDKKPARPLDSGR